MGIALSNFLPFWLNYFQINIIIPIKIKAIPIKTFVVIGSFNLIFQFYQNDVII